MNYMHMPIADAGLSPTQWQANTFPNDFRKKITVIHDGIDTNLLAPDENAILTLNESLKIGRHDEILTFVNRELEPFRGYHIFMRSLPEILRRRPKLRVLIVGGNAVSYGPKPVDSDHSWRDIYASEVRLKMNEQEWDRVHFVGKIPYSHFITLLQVSTVHVYLSYPFVLSWSMLEAMSIGCAVVASDTDPVKEMIEHNKTGRLVNFFDNKQLCETVLSLLDQPLERERIGRNARDFIKSELDLNKKCIPQQMQWIESLCHSNNL
jgi:glycosyltransferase involved in cell wall biosynthesis